jgi:hypothetical protein
VHEEESERSPRCRERHVVEVVCKPWVGVKVDERRMVASSEEATMRSDCSQEGVGAKPTCADFGQNNHTHDRWSYLGRELIAADEPAWCCARVAESKYCRSAQLHTTRPGTEAPYSWMLSLCNFHSVGSFWFYSYCPDFCVSLWTATHDDNPR